MVINVPLAGQMECRQSLIVRRIALSAGFLFAFAAAAQTPDGAALFKKHCAVCHFQGNTTRAPVIDMLSLEPRQALVDALEKGSMKVQASALSPAERKAVIDFLVKPTAEPQAHSGAKCSSAPPAFTQLSGWNGWGVDLANTRFQPKAGLTAEQVGNLKLKWAFGIPSAAVAYGQPTIADGRLFFGT
ncbi:MAG TPA: c-type cytochrome, partial [Terriglobales bacterium]|nr:c-type cytochrome [Terriglobales bacterium]